MKNYIGSLFVMVTMLAYSWAWTNCTQPMEMRSHHKILLHKYRCDQVVHNADLEMEPEILYNGHLRQGYNYTLLLLENNNNTGSYKIHWFLTDIIPMNKSLTANKTIIGGYRPPMNNVTTFYTVLLYGHHRSLNLKTPSFTEMDNFIPNTWVAPIQNISLENNATFHVTGRNTSHLHPFGPIHPHTPTQTNTSQTHPTFHTPKTTSRPQYVTETITEKRPGYHFYNSTNTSSNNHNSPSHPHKSGASSNVCSIIFMSIPLISVITKVIY